MVEQQVRTVGELKTLYKVKEVIGKGAFSSVRMAVRRAD
jgi:hypothetical protein